MNISVYRYDAGRTIISGIFLIEKAEPGLRTVPPIPISQNIPFLFMAVHPIEERYGTKEMRAVWSEQNRFSCIVRAEVALAKAEAVCGMIPPTAALEIEADAPGASLERAKAIELEISHDMMAVVRAIAEVCGESGRWVHYGATSNDILDTATGLQLGQSLDLIDQKLRVLLAVLLKRAEETKTLVCIGRTHGQHGVPTTYGLRFAIWASEVGRHIERLSQLRPRVVVGQMTGAVGTQAALGPKGMEVQAAMMENLGMGSVDVSNQVISRDRYAEYFMFCAGVATTLDKIGVEVRSLQRTEIGEVEEAFGAKQVGSSTMPHKRNPIKSEQVCGLARIIRSAVEPALQNNTLWDERDLTNSSCERVIFPESSILTDHCLRLMAGVLDGLVINRAAIRRNLSFLHGINMAESVMIELTKKGMSRQDSHERVRMASMQALAEGKSLADVLSTDPEVVRFCSRNDIAALLNPDAYIGTAVQQVERVIGKLAPLSG
jgi:adenylosuccinate lyase